jgi:hypothetical protein
MLIFPAVECFLTFSSTFSSKVMGRQFVVLRRKSADDLEE